MISLHSLPSASCLSLTSLTWPSHKSKGPVTSSDKYHFQLALSQQTFFFFATRQHKCFNRKMSTLREVNEVCQLWLDVFSGSHPAAPNPVRIMALVPMECWTGVRELSVELERSQEEFFRLFKGYPLTPPKSHRIKSWSIHLLYMKHHETLVHWTASWNVKLETWWSRRKQHTIGHSYRNSNENIQFGLTLLFAKLEFKWPAVRRTLSPRQMSTYICQPSVKRLWEIMMDP